MKKNCLEFSSSVPTLKRGGIVVAVVIVATLASVIPVIGFDALFTVVGAPIGPATLVGWLVTALAVGRRLGWHVASGSRSGERGRLRPEGTVAGGGCK